MIIQIKGVSVQVIARKCQINEISIEFYDGRGETVAVFPKQSVDKVIDFGKVLYLRGRG